VAAGDRRPNLAPHLKPASLTGCLKTNGPHSDGFSPQCRQRHICAYQPYPVSSNVSCGVSAPHLSQNLSVRSGGGGRSRARNDNQFPIRRSAGERCQDIARKFVHSVCQCPNQEGDERGYR
jgi:hypothetical protein